MKRQENRDRKTLQDIIIGRDNLYEGYCKREYENAPRTWFLASKIAAFQKFIYQTRSRAWIKNEV